jgi:hypothetical protein
MLPLMEQSKEESASVNIMVFAPNNSLHPLQILNQIAPEYLLGDSYTYCHVILKLSVFIFGASLLFRN